MATLITYRQTLMQLNSNVLSMADPDWYRFVLDHRTYLKNGAEVFTISDQVLNRCEYDMKRFLIYCNRDPEMDWIVFLINDFDSEIGFYLGMPDSNLYVPVQAELVKLYATYKTTKCLTS